MGIRTGLLAAIAATVLLFTACGGEEQGSACDELSVVCDSCADAIAKMTCDAHVEAGAENVCELDMQNGVFELACDGI